MQSFRCLDNNIIFLKKYFKNLTYAVNTIEIVLCISLSISHFCYIKTNGIAYFLTLFAESAVSIYRYLSLLFTFMDKSGEPIISIYCQFLIFKPQMLFFIEAMYKRAIYKGEACRIQFRRGRGEMKKEAATTSHTRAKL